MTAIVLDTEAMSLLAVRSASAEVILTARDLRHWWAVFCTKQAQVRSTWSLRTVSQRQSRTAVVSSSCRTSATSNGSGSKTLTGAVGLR
jgi:hypothetical protein